MLYRLREDNVPIIPVHLHFGIEAENTDLDGAFGKEQSPYDLDTIADLQNIPHLLSEKGYSPDDINNIMNRNFINFLRQTWA